VTTPDSIEDVLSAWPEAMLLVSGDGAIRSMNDAARRLMRLPDSAPAASRLAEILGEAPAAALVPAAGPGGECRIGDDGASAARPVIRARSGRLASGSFLVRLDDATEEYRLRSHLEHAGRLASIGELLSSVAHELSNPLTTVLGYADLLLLDDDPKLPREELERIRAEALRCRRIVGNLLDLSRAESVDMRPLSLAQVIDKVIEFRAYATQITRIQLGREVADDLPAINGDQHRLVQAVLNLVTNAEDALRDVAAVRRIVLRARRTPTGAAIEVEDNGCGVPEPIREFIFEPFFTTKPRGRGTGLGLSLVRATAQAHGGTARLENNPTGGSRFVMELPA
jgi:two-component system, NtrC family, sensor kinase